MCMCTTTPGRHGTNVYVFAGVSCCMHICMFSMDGCTVMIAPSSGDSDDFCNCNCCCSAALIYLIVLWSYGIPMIMTRRTRVPPILTTVCMSFKFPGHFPVLKFVSHGVVKERSGYCVHHESWLYDDCPWRWRWRAVTMGSERRDSRFWFDLIRSVRLFCPSCLFCLFVCSVLFVCLFCLLARLTTGTRDSNAPRVWLGGPAATSTVTASTCWLPYYTYTNTLPTIQLRVHHHHRLCGYGLWLAVYGSWRL